MLDLKALARTFHDPLKTYSGIPQIIGADQDIPEDLLQTPRIAWKITSPYIPDRFLPEYERKAVPGTIDPENFSQDVEVTAKTTPEAVFSFTIYGEKGDPNIAQYIQKAREWFAVPFLGPEMLSGYGVVISDVSAIQDRGVLLEFEFEERQGFDVRFRFEEKVTTIKPTIEQIQDVPTIE